MYLCTFCISEIMTFQDKAKKVSYFKQKLDENDCVFFLQVFTSSKYSNNWLMFWLIIIWFIGDRGRVFGEVENCRDLSVCRSPYSGWSSLWSIGPELIARARNVWWLPGFSIRWQRIMVGNSTIFQYPFFVASSTKLFRYYCNII